MKTGVGINLRPRPKREQRFGGGFVVVVRSWKALLFGRLK